CAVVAGGGQRCQADGSGNLGSLGRAADAVASGGGVGRVAAALLPDRSEWFTRPGDRLYAQAQGPAGQCSARSNGAEAGQRAVAAGVGSGAKGDPADATRGRGGPPPRPNRQPPKGGAA